MKIKIGIMLLLLSVPAFAEDQITGQDLLTAVETEVETRLQTQQLREEWQNQKETLTVRYQELESQEMRLKRQVARQQRGIIETNNYIAESERIIAQEKIIAAQLDDYLWDIYAQLQLNLQGLPYLALERRTRLESLRATLESPSAGPDDKYRRMMETLLIEVEYSSSCETYSAEITIADQTLTAEILKIGSLALFARTADQMAVYEPGQKKWQPLARKYQAAVGKAYAITNKEQILEMVRLPMGRILAP